MRLHRLHIVCLVFSLEAPPKGEGQRMPEQEDAGSDWAIAEPVEYIPVKGRVPYAALGVFT